MSPGDPRPALSCWADQGGRRTPQSWSAGTDTAVFRNGICQWPHSKASLGKTQSSDYFSLSSACIIDEEDSFILVGGWQGEGKDHRRVSRYDFGGFEKDLPSLNIARHNSGCAYYLTNNRKVRTFSSFSRTI